MRYVATSSKRDLAQHTQAKHTLVAFPLEPGHLEFRVHRVAEQYRLAEPAALLEEGDHCHDEEPVGNPGAEARLARVVFVVVDGVVVAREPREEEEVASPSVWPGLQNRSPSAKSSR
jgi:hypothetical protein